MTVPSGSFPVLATLGGPRPVAGAKSWVVEVATDDRTRSDYRRLRHEAFVVDQALFPATDHDDVDDDPRTVVLVARATDGTVLGGVRLAPCHDPDIGWWAGSRLVCRPGAPRGTGAALVRAACARAEQAGALRFDACVQPDKERFFARLGWERVADVMAHGTPHVAMRHPIRRLAAQTAGKADLGSLVGELLARDTWIGDDGVPIPGSGLVAACDAITPSMIERDPWWAGWCSILVNANDLAAMGAPPIGLLDSVAAPTASMATRVLAGLRDAAAAWDVPVLGGHTQLGVPAALSVTMLGRTDTPVPGGQGHVGDTVHLTTDVAGGWRPGHTGRQWDSTTSRSPDALRAMARLLVDGPRPHAAKDVSMAGLVGTLGMLAEASGTGAELDVAAVPRPPAATVGDWLSCFPGFGLLTTGPAPEPGRTPVTTAACGVLTRDPGIRLRWPDGAVTPALAGPVTGLGPALGQESHHG